MARITILFAAVAVLVAGACGGGGGDDEAAAAPSTTADATTTTTEALPAAEDLLPPEDTDGYVLLAGDGVSMEVSSAWTDVDLGPGSGGEPALQAAPSLAEFGNGGSGVGISVTEGEVPPSDILDNLEQGLSVEGYDVPVDSCEAGPDDTFTQNPEFVGTVRFYTACDGVENPNVGWMLMSLAADSGEATVGMYAYLNTDQDAEDVVQAMRSLSLGNPLGG